MDGFYYKPRIDEEVMREVPRGNHRLKRRLAGEVEIPGKGLYEDAKAAAKTPSGDLRRGAIISLNFQDQGIPMQRQVKSRGSCASQKN